MARYVVSSDEGSSFSVDQLGSSGEYQMSLARWVTEAQAQIIAFALNAVAEGKALMASSQQQRLVIDAGGTSYYGALELYEGPTEGVGP